MYILLETAKNHLNIDQTFHDDDQYLLHLITAAEEAIAKRIDRSLESCVTDCGVLPQTIQHSILILIANWYANRESYTNLATNEIPQSFNWLADLEKKYYIP